MIRNVEAEEEEEEEAEAEAEAGAENDDDGKRTLMPESAAILSCASMSTFANRTVECLALNIMIIMLIKTNKSQQRDRGEKENRGRISDVPNASMFVTLVVPRQHKTRGGSSS